MIFSSIPFLFLFLPFFLIIYYIVPFKYKNYILLIFSLIFYAWGEPIYIFLMLFSALVDYINGQLLMKNPSKKKTYLFCALAINISLLCFFKYSSFLIETINNLFNISIPLIKVSLPIGISFYTFQTISYSLDVYRGNVKPEKNYFYYLTYISMFPQLIAGPIVRYKTISNKLYARTISFKNFNDGLIRFLNGLFKKVLLANNIGYVWNLISENPTSVISTWIGALAFTMQIYYDFSGYSDMAIGIGKMLGFKFLENFNYPYIAKSITDFWRRWHISLSSWFKDYVYIPLGGSRVSKLINIRNILIVWMLTGIWHGAAWNFVLWGLYYGIILLMEKFIYYKYMEKWPKFLRHFYTLIIVMTGWIIFAFDDINLMNNYLSSMFFIKEIPFLDNTVLFYIVNYGILFIIGILFCLPLYKIINKKIINKKIFSIILIFIYIFLFLLVIAFLVSDTYNPFMYFRF